MAVSSITKSTIYTHDCRTSDQFEQSGLLLGLDKSTVKYELPEDKCKTEETTVTNVTPESTQQNIVINNKPGKGQLSTAQLVISLENPEELKKFIINLQKGVKVPLSSHILYRVWQSATGGDQTFTIDENSYQSLLKNLVFEIKKTDPTYELPDGGSGTPINRSQVGSTNGDYTVECNNVDQDRWTNTGSAGYVPIDYPFTVDEVEKFKALLNISKICTDKYGEGFPASRQRRWIKFNVASATIDRVRAAIDFAQNLTTAPDLASLKAEGYSDADITDLTNAYDLITLLKGDEEGGWMWKSALSVFNSSLADSKDELGKRLVPEMRWADWASLALQVSTALIFGLIFFAAHPIGIAYLSRFKGSAARMKEGLKFMAKAQSEGMMDSDVNMETFIRDLSAKAVIEQRAIDKGEKPNPITSAMKSIFEDMIERLDRSDAASIKVAGKSGSGKSYHLAAFALYLLEHKPEAWLVSLSLGKMVAGTKYRGMFEERLVLLINAVELHVDIRQNATKLAKKIDAAVPAEAALIQEMTNTLVGDIEKLAQIKEDFGDEARAILKEINKSRSAETPLSADQLKDILKRIKEPMVAIDEASYLRGAGAAEGSMDAGAILKTALERDKFKAIAIMTDQESIIFDEDPTLGRRFSSMVYIPEKTPDEIREMLQTTKRQEFESKYPGLKWTDEAIEIIVNFTRTEEEGIARQARATQLIDSISSSEARKNRKTIGENGHEITSEIVKASIAKAEMDKFLLRRLRKPTIALQELQDRLEIFPKTYEALHPNMIDDMTELVSSEGNLNLRDTWLSINGERPEYAEAGKMRDFFEGLASSESDEEFLSKMRAGARAAKQATNEELAEFLNKYEATTPIQEAVVYGLLSQNPQLSLKGPRVNAIASFFEDQVKILESLQGNSSSELSWSDTVRFLFKDIIPQDISASTNEEFLVKLETKVAEAFGLSTQEYEQKILDKWGELSASKRAIVALHILKANQNSEIEVIMETLAWNDTRMNYEAAILNRVAPDFVVSSGGPSINWTEMINAITTNGASGLPADEILTKLKLKLTVQGLTEAKDNIEAWESELTPAKSTGAGRKKVAETMLATLKRYGGAMGLVDSELRTEIKPALVASMRVSRERVDEALKSHRSMERLRQEHERRESNIRLH